MKVQNNCDDSSSTFSSANESEIIKQVDDKFEERLDPEETGDSASMLPYCFESTLKEDISVLGENPNESKVQGENNQFIFTLQPSLKRNRKENGGEEGTQIDEEVTGVMRNGRPSIYSGSPF
uniref:Uncharacterized protein n=1 Tax=Timema bartmani TaxID=61472 RepID=A0A7R9F5B0_9NEOP|nr:unnamed protein product [Timema bartmani]